MLDALYELMHYKNDCGQMPGHEKRCSCGFPLAQAYVPFQEMNEIYPPEEGLIKGTIYPELDMPYWERPKKEGCGCSCNQKEEKPWTEMPY